MDTIIYLAHTRPPEGEAAIAKSLEFTKNLVIQAAAYLVPEFIYISSQSVYGIKTDSSLWNENSPPSSNSPYAMAKYADVTIVQELKRCFPNLLVLIVRLSRIYRKINDMQRFEIPQKLIADFLQKKLFLEATRHSIYQGFYYLYLSH